jgi:hypothetical protein
MSLPCSFGEAHGKDSVAWPDIAVRSLPCGFARQRLCCATSLHNNDRFSRSDVLVCDHKVEVLNKFKQLNL